MSEEKHTKINLSDSEVEAKLFFKFRQPFKSDLPIMTRDNDIKIGTVIISKLLLLLWLF